MLTTDDWLICTDPDALEAWMVNLVGSEKNDKVIVLALLLALENAIDRARAASD